MLDMSLGKLAVLAILILIVWYGFKYAARIEAVRQSARAEALRRRAGAGAGTSGGAGQGMRATARPVEDLVKCQKCGAYVAAQGAANCGKSGCPWGA
jgi:TRAP-type C4-dicarboxylate transport system permease small subunit